MPKVIIQIAYDAANLDERSHMLKHRGHEVISILGNSDALRRRDEFKDADLVLIGHAADVAVRRKIAQWLKQSFPAIQLIAIAENAEIPEADYTVSPDDPAGLIAAAER
jgi:hypothetical protein